VLESALERVRHVEFHPRVLPEIQYTRLNMHYRPIVELSKLVLRATSYELGHGNVRGTAFLMDMNRVFEDFVVVALREELRLSERTFPQGSRGHPLHLAEGRRVRLKPDISWWARGRCIFVGDVKYKRLQLAGYENADLYQLLAYTTATNLPSGLLIYAAGEAEQTVYEVKKAGKRLEVLALDLSGEPAEILSQVAAVGRRVREHAASIS
jgi:5-methylcytosine-specific restriction enzyme subunit McrC